MENPPKTTQPSLIWALFCLLVSFVGLIVFIFLFWIKLATWFGLPMPATVVANLTARPIPAEQPTAVIPDPEALPQGDRIPLPVLTPLTDTISLSAIKGRLQFKNELVQDGDLVRADLAVGDNAKHNRGSFEVHGQNQAAADNLVIGCHRYGPDGNEKTEEPTSECGKLYQTVLSIFVDNAQAFTFYLMDEAYYISEIGRFKRAKITGRPINTGKMYSTARITIGKLVFSYEANMLIICRVDSYACPQK